MLAPGGRGGEGVEEVTHLQGVPRGPGHLVSCASPSYPKLISDQIDCFPTSDVSPTPPPLTPSSRHPHLHLHLHPHLARWCLQDLRRRGFFACVVPLKWYHWLPTVGGRSQRPTLDRMDHALDWLLRAYAQVRRVTSPFFRPTIYPSLPAR